MHYFSGRIRSLGFWGPEWAPEGGYPPALGLGVRSCRGARVHTTFHARVFRWFHTPLFRTRVSYCVSMVARVVLSFVAPRSVRTLNFSFGGAKQMSGNCIIPGLSGGRKAAKNRP